VAEGRGVPAELPPLRSRAGLLRAEVAEEEARLGSALRSLEGILTLPPGTLAGVSGPMLNASNAPLGGSVDDHPEIDAREAAEETHRARSKEAEAGAWPDFVVGLSYEDFDEQNGGRVRSLGVMFEMPLPLFDRNQGSIRASRSELRRAETLTRDARLKIATAHAEAIETARALETSRQARRDEVIPALAEDLALAEAAYRSGRTDLAPVLDARLALAEEELAAVRVEERLAEKVLDALALSGLVPATWLIGGPSR
jgi:cobalt-zinc-cadmium efflux system outer membrane protein